MKICERLCSVRMWNQTKHRHIWNQGAEMNVWAWGQRKSHTRDLHDLCSSPNIAKITVVTRAENNILTSDLQLRRVIHNFREWCCHLYNSCSSAMQRYVIALSCLGSQCTNFQAAEWTCWFLTSFYLESCIWNDAISQCIRQMNSIKFCANIAKSAVETLTMITKAFRKESVSRTRVEGHARYRADWKKARYVKSKVKSMLIIFFDNKGIVH
jgi:hypothetical protein